MKHLPPLIGVEELSTQYTSPDIVVLDSRYALMDVTKGRRDFMQSHIPGAFFMDIGHDLSSPVIPGVTGRHPLPNPEVLAFTLRACGLDPDSKVVIYDQSNSAYAARAWWLLRWLGHENVRVLNGGLDAWTQARFPIDNTWPAPKKGQFIPDVQQQMTVGIHDVQVYPGQVVDSREYKRFTGETEPIDPVAGHIPGAICKPYLDNTDAQGYWKSADELREKFADLEHLNKAPIFYCGSGVTACHNILAYKIATGNDALLYPGSWSEWIHYYPAATGDM